MIFAGMPGTDIKSLYLVPENRLIKSSIMVHILGNFNVVPGSLSKLSDQNLGVVKFPTKLNRCNGLQVYQGVSGSADQKTENADVKPGSISVGRRQGLKH
jgi:hypothetical protein